MRFLSKPRPSAAWLRHDRVSNGSRRVRLARNGRAVVAGETGELQIRTPFGMLGYLDNAELTDASFDGDYFGTGDLARMTASGYVARPQAMRQRLWVCVSPQRHNGAPQRLSRNGDIYCGLPFAGFDRKSSAGRIAKENMPQLSQGRASKQYASCAPRPCA